MSDEQKDKLHSECRDTTHQKHFIFVCESDERALETAYLAVNKETPLVIGTIGHIDHGVTTLKNKPKESEIIGIASNSFIYSMKIKKSYKSVDIAKRRR